VNPVPAQCYNLVVIGAGTAGLVAAAGAAGLGAKVALVERHLLGGDCLNVGCVPSKALISAARVAATVRGAGGFGVHVPPGVRFEFGEAMERMRRLRAGIAPHDSAQRFRDLGVDVFLGEGRFIGPGRMEVDGRMLAFKRAVIATGARAALPDVEGLASVPYLTNETLFTLTELPRRMAVIGAGPIGCEMAQAFARFGSDVLMVANGHGILPREDADAATHVLAALRRDGVRVLCCGQGVRLMPAQGRRVRVVLESHGQACDETVDTILVAAGRAPNVEGLGLETVGVGVTARGITVDDRLRTTHRAIYAAGDVCSAYRFTHAADAMARIVIQNALFGGRARASALTIPWCTYTDPEIAHVGLSETQAREQGVAIDTFTRDLADVDRAVLEGRTGGLVRVHVRKGTDRIMGATIVAANAGDMISEITLAMTHGLGLRKIAACVHPYPTQSEAIRHVADAWNRTRLTPRVAGLLRWWLARRRDA
jgi:pyruvate/2-oxoglutarate dehydrogenase complex dihydrolipoamide dehydrogenase (E3) component